MHITELRTLHQSRNYEEIHGRIQKEMKKIVLKDKLPVKDLDELKAFIKEEIKRCMYDPRSIPGPFINITLLLGDDFESVIKDMLVSYLLALYSADYQEFLNCKFQKLTSLQECFVWMEDILAKISLRYSNIPADWNLSSEILMKFHILTKQKMCDYFFYCEIEEPDFVEAFDITLKYERKFAKILKKGGCCIPTKGEISLVVENDTYPANTSDANIIYQDHCSHSMMLSSLFLPNIRVYLKAFFDYFLREGLKQNEVEIYVISGFLNFFRSLGKILKKIAYFNDKQAYMHLIQYFDSYLSILIRNIRLETELYEAAIILNTFLFIRETAADFLDQVYEKADIRGDIPKTYTEIRRIEKFHNISIDEYFCKHFENINFSSLDGLSKKVIQLLDEKVTTEKIKGLSDAVKVSLLEGAISHVFLKFYSLKIAPETSEILLLEVAEIKKYLKTKMDVIPLINVIERYLKIFLCPAKDKKCFVENFNLLSEGIFSFEQIINNVECDDESVGELFSVYEKRLKE